MEVPRLGVKLELQLPAYTTATITWDLSHICDVCHSSWQNWILNPLIETMDQIIIFMDTSQFRYCWATTRTAFFFFQGCTHEVPRLGVESELQLPTYTTAQSCSCCWPTPQAQQSQIRATSETYTTAQGNAGSLTHWARPGIEPASSWILVRFISPVSWWELQEFHSFMSYSLKKCVWAWSEQSQFYFVLWTSLSGV